MAAPERFSGVLSPVLTPFNSDLSPDPDRLVKHCNWLLSQGVGLAPFGTTSEGNSLSVEEKKSLLDYLIDAGIDRARLMVGTGHCALADTVELTFHAARLGCGGVLMLPPFYYKDVGDDGLFRSIAEVIERVGSDALRIYLYHIPPIAEVGFTPRLVERIASDYPATVVGIKDSSGDWSNTEALLQLGIDDFRIFAGNEAFLLRNMRSGGAGCISATANINPGAIHELYENWQRGEAESMQTRLDAVRAAVEEHPMIPALKAVIAGFLRDEGWATVRPPLVPLDTVQTSGLESALHALDFEMPGLIA